MAGTLNIGPVGRNPDRARGEHQYAFMKGADTYVLVSKGGGQLHTLIVGVAGSLAKFYDTPSDGTTDETTQIATVSLAAVTATPLILDVAFSKGLTCVVTGASAELTVSFDGAQTTSPRQFGTQDSNPGR